MSALAVRSLSNGSPPTQKTTTTQVNQFELPCPSFSNLVENGSKYLPNEWTISRATDASSCFLAHVVSESPSALPSCDRAIYLTLQRGQNDDVANDDDAMIFDCSELFLRDGVLKKKSYAATVEFLGDLLAMLFSHPQDDEEEEEEDSEGELQDGEEEGEIVDSRAAYRASPFSGESPNGIDEDDGRFNHDGARYVDTRVNDADELADERNLERDMALENLGIKRELDPERASFGQVVDVWTGSEGMPLTR